MSNNYISSSNYKVLLSDFHDKEQLFRSKRGTCITAEKICLWTAGPSFHGERIIVPEFLGASRDSNREEYRIAFYDLGARVSRILRLRRITKRLGKNSVKNICERWRRREISEGCVFVVSRCSMGEGPSTTRNSRVGISLAIINHSIVTLWLVYGSVHTSAIWHNGIFGGISAINCR